MKEFKLRRLPIVANDLAEAGEWYEEQNPAAGLADAFDSEAESVIEQLALHALHHRVRFEDVRRAPLQRFAFYGVYFVVREDAVIVIAVFHDSRDPARIRRRRQEIDPQL